MLSVLLLCSGPLNVAIKVLCLLPLLGEAFGRTKFHAQSLAQRRYGKPKSYFVHRCLETCLSILGRPNLHDLHGFALEHCFGCSHSLESCVLRMLPRRQDSASSDNVAAVTKSLQKIAVLL